jgi:hypothetical protein
MLNFVLSAIAADRRAPPSIESLLSFRLSVKPKARVRLSRPGKRGNGVRTRVPRAANNGGRKTK